MQPKWILRNRNLDYDRISQKFNIDKLVAKVIRNRDIVTDEEFSLYLNGSLADCHDPVLLDGMDEGTELIIEKISEGKKIRVIGDYDVDGVTSAYMLTKGLKDLGADVSYRIPHRIRDGYGMNVRLIEEAYADGVDTIITCDNGIAAFDAVDRAKQLGMTVIVTDHHEPKERRVMADVVIDQKLESCDYPYEDICGATIAFKFIKFLYGKMNREFDEKYYIPFVAIATVCDVMRLQDESRIYVREGARLIPESENIGLQALLTATNRVGKAVNSTTMGFILGPCINSAGRLESAEQSVELFFSTDKNDAVSKAMHLVELNEGRKSVCEEGMARAIEMLESSPEYRNDKVIVVYISGLHESLAGIVAAKIKEKYYRPTIVFTDSTTNDKIYKGSARGIDGYNLAEELEKLSSLLVKSGGHKKAAGLSILKENLDIFRIALNENAVIKDEDLIPKLIIDAKVPMSYFTVQNVEQLEALEPFGEGNEPAVFADAGLKVRRMEIRGKNKNCLWLYVEDMRGSRYRMISFDVAGILNDIKEWFGEAECDRILDGASNNVVLNIAYHPEINEYQGTKNVQFMIDSMQKA
ncbi:exonuclease RecJ [Eubacterium ruminantium]|nr:exonuclease RecJ [Eubacterium ruminantium]